MKFKKLRKIYRILFPKHHCEVSVFENNLNLNHAVEKITITENDEYLVELKNKSKVIVRNYTHSDYDVFKQIFNFEEYRIVVSIFQLNPILLDNEENVFIDAGANVGYTTAFFSSSAFFSKTFFSITKNKRVTENAIISAAHSLFTKNCIHTALRKNTFRKQK